MKEPETKPTPIAARLDAEPGWRVVMLKWTDTRPEGAAEDECEVLIYVVEVVKWGVTYKPASTSKASLAFATMFFGVISPYNSPSVDLVPLDADGVRLPPEGCQLLKVAAPDDGDSDALIGEARTWLHNIGKVADDMQSGKKSKIVSER